VLEVPLLEDTVEVKRVAVNRIIDGPVPVREEGNVTIIPVFEEVLVVEKRLMLKEEIHLVRQQLATRERQTFALRKEEVHVLRTNDQPAGSNAEVAGIGTGIAKRPASAEGGATPARGMEP
jgi:stress response protein YsnF